MKRPPTEAASRIGLLVRRFGGSRQRGIAGLTIRVRIVEARGIRLLPSSPVMEVRRSLKIFADEAEISVRAGECSMCLATSRSVGAGLLGWGSRRLIREGSRG
jgi:hypothetical protein